MVSHGTSRPPGRWGGCWSSGGHRRSGARGWTTISVLGTPWKYRGARQSRTRIVMYSRQLAGRLALGRVVRLASADQRAELRRQPISREDVIVALRALNDHGALGQQQPTGRG